MRPAAFQSLGSAFFLSLAACAVTSAPLQALDLSSVQRAAGVWELSRDDGARKCSIQLRPDAAGAANAIGMPPGCRHAMPVVANVAGWTLAAASKIDFTDRRGVAILSFAAKSNGLTATGPGGEAYVLMTASDVAQGLPRPVSRVDAAPAPAGPPVRAADIPGRYAVLRDGAKDTGCMLTLHPGAKAQLAPACRDNGFVIFDPQSWSLANGKLRITARKGHHAIFERGADGSWQKDPKDGGKPLGFRKM